MSDAIREHGRSHQLKTHNSEMQANVWGLLLISHCILGNTSWHQEDSLYHPQVCSTGCRE